MHYEKIIPAMRVFQTNYDFIQDCADENSNGNLSAEIRKMLKYVDLNRKEYFDKLPEVIKMMKGDKKNIDKSKRIEKLKKQKKKIDKELTEYGEIEDNML